jgi:tetratricopeptide (TPR) repeat protein
VVDSIDNNLYTNYLGYILIDHEIDVQKGISYIKRVLQTQPNSAFYVDSLAWGYYKLGECKKAQKLMQKVAELGEGSEPEVLKHKKAIDACVANPNYKKVIMKR